MSSFFNNAANEVASAVHWVATHPVNDVLYTSAVIILAAGVGEAIRQHFGIGKTIAKQMKL